jgi:hypothetical protein
MKNTPPNKTKTLTTVTSILSLACALGTTARAQVGSGWTQVTFSERFEYETNDILNTISPPPSSFTSPYLHYDNTSGIETFQLITHASNRAEIRPNDDYSSGSRQFAADVMVVSSTTTGESIHQVFNGPTGPYLLLRENSQDSTHFTVTVGGTLPSGDHSGVIFTNTYGTWFHLNSINSLTDGKTYIYYNSTLVWTGTNPGGTFYTKYGCYGTHDDAHPSKIQFKNVVLYSGGSASGGSIDTSAVYQLQNEASGLVLNNQGSLTNGSKITQWSSISSDNLRWKFITTSGGYYQLNSIKSGLDAVVQSASTAQGAGIIQWSFGSAGNDQWKPVFNGDGSITLYNLHSGLVLEDPGSSTSTSTQMDQWGANGGANQNWKLIKQ